MPKAFITPWDKRTGVELYDEQFLTRVFDSVTDPFAIYDRDLHIIKANKAFMNIFQISDQEFVGRFCYEIFYSAPRFANTVTFKRSFAPVNQTWWKNLFHYRMDGTAFGRFTLTP